MSIVCLRWGSLCWNPETLPVAGLWQEDDPILPLEFARVSDDGRITLVLTDAGALVSVLWAPLRVATLDEAVQALAAREGVDRTERAIGRNPSADRSYLYSDVISHWATRKRFAGVVWTVLKPVLSKDKRGPVPTLEELRRHVASLDPEARERALEYVVRAPVQVQTPYRQTLQAMLEEEASNAR